MSRRHNEKGHKAQHFVPKSYLSAWIDRDCPPGHEPYVWVHPREGGPPRARPPAKVCKEKDIYTIPMPGGGRDLRLEHGLQTLEDAFARTRRDFIQLRKPIPLVPRVKLIAFFVALQWRTPQARDHIRKQWGRVLDVAEDLDRQMKRATPEERKAAALVGSISSSGASMRMEDVRRVVEHPIQTLMPSHLRVQTPLLEKLKLTVLCAAGDDRFITSDSPCVWCDPEGHKRPPMFRGPALMYDTVEITMPISPTRLLMLSHKHDLWDYLDVGDDIVTEVNRRTWAYANTEIITQTQTLNLAALECGREPAQAPEAGEGD